MQKEKTKPGFIPTWLAQLVRETCGIILQKGAKEEVIAYAIDVKLPFSNCTTCNEETPDIKTEFLNVCAICQTIKG